MWRSGVRSPGAALYYDMTVMNWVIFLLGCTFTVVFVLQQKAIKKHQRERTESLGMVLLLLAYLEAQARAARERPGNHDRDES